ncbi:unnamed protein product [Rotaria socialis]|uniref:Uncharacterized protein n=1 Tax=Rotaria socialis TaxID=392032 RepID=A0A820FJQ7_9BILA|nr:unnamed protein product [Rotaria socialis]CAF4265804.1 unnamed protein product [Rotaria socialis]
MGQDLSLDKLKTLDLLTVNNQRSNNILSAERKEDAFLFLPLEVIDAISKNSISSPGRDQKSSIEFPITKQTLSKQIRQDLFLLTNSSAVDELNTKIANIITQVFDRIATTNANLQNAIQSINDKQQQLKNSYAEKLNDDKNITTSIFAQSFNDSANSNNASSENKKELHQFQAEQLSFFAVQSLISMLMMLLKSIHQYDSTIVHQMLNLTNQLIEQIPLNYLSPDIYKQSSNLFKSLKPLTNYIHELSKHTEVDPIAASQSIKILLNFSVIKASLKEALPLIRSLMFNTTDTYDIRRLFIELNNDLTKTMDQIEKEKQTRSETTTTPQGGAANSNETSTAPANTESPVSTENTSDNQCNFSAALEYLKSIEAFPNTQLLTINEKKFTGQFISSVLLVHIDLHNQLQAKSQFDRGSMHGSFSFSFESETFKYLYELIEQFLAGPPSNHNFEYILDVCLRLFTTHLQFLIASKIDNFHDFLSESDIEKWFTLILKLTLHDKSEERKKQVSKALIYLMEKQAKSFFEMLAFTHRYIMENKHPILVELFFDLLKKDVFIYKWIEALSVDHPAQDKTLAYATLHSFIDIVLKPSSMDAEHVKRIQDIVRMFQELLFVYLNNQPITVPDKLESSALSTVFIEYATHVIQYCIKEGIKSDLLDRLLLGLCALTDGKFNFAIIQPIFATLLPLFAEYLSQTTATDDVDTPKSYLISWLLGKMSYRLIVGPPQSPLEKKYSTTLKLPLFAGGYETLATENNSYLSQLFKSDLAVYSQFVLPYRRQESLLDSEFLLSIYNNADQGAQLISKMKLFIRDKQRVLPKSIESDANDASAVVFAVYIKHYRRIDLAQHELTQPIDQRPHAKLLLLYDYANQVRTVFATTKARGGDCNELCKRIKNDALLLLASVKESEFIPTIKEDFALVMPIAKEFKLQRQTSRWTKAKHILRVLRHAMNACVRLKYLMLEKKQAVEQKKDCESVLHRAIVTCLYGNDVSAAAVGNDDLKIEPDEVVQCLIRQYQRAMTRLITYRFCSQFIEQLINVKDNKRVLNMLVMTLSNLKDNNLDWHYLEHVQASNQQLKKDIGYRYYSIVKQILSFSKESSMESNTKAIFIFSLFNQVNLSYDLKDLCHLNHFQYVQELFDLFVSYIHTNSTDAVSTDMKLAAFNWFRLLVLRLCENIDIEELRSKTNLGSRKSHKILLQQRDLIFNKLILSELKQLQEKKSTAVSNSENENPSLQNASIGYFIKSTTSEESSLPSFNVDGCINQYLMLLLRCAHLYDHVRSNHATMDYIQQLLILYHQNQLISTRLLALKIIRDLLVFLPENTNETTTRSFVENLLTDILLTIGQNFNLLETTKTSLDIVIELVYIYRTMISQNSPWQKVATKFIVDAIKSSTNFNFASLESVDIRQINLFLASLCILGGYIRPYCLGSTVEIFVANRSIHELESATIIEINASALDTDSTDITPYFVQYSSTNQTEWVSSNQLRIMTDVLPPNLVLLPMDDAVHTILDTLGYLAQIDTTSIDSLLLLQIKRRAITAFYPLLNNKATIDIFMQKPYASIIAKLSISVDSVDSINATQANDLRLFNRLHLEQYDLSLDKCERTQQIVEDAQNMVRTANEWNQMKIIRDSNALQILSPTDSIEETWKPIASKRLLQSYRRGRIGTDDIRIVSLPANDTLPALEECGDKHKFKGRINITDDTNTIRYPTFILDGVEFTEGNWYFCVKLMLGGAAQIGWATTGFTPMPENSKGVGEDQFSWCYDGSRGICYHNTSTSFGHETRWDAEDVCGCGIEIDGENTTIKYWLNGKFLGTAFSHSSNTTIESIIKTDLLPNGLGSTRYFPGVTVQVYNSVANTGAIEFIFSPEDMTKCPLPKGYKPLLVPTLATIDNVLVAYPYSAYLVGNNKNEYFYTNRCSKKDLTDEKTSMLRDFVNDHHFEVPFNSAAITVDHHQLKLTEDSDGFPLSIDTCQSLTISFDFEIFPTDSSENHADGLDIVLFSLENEIFSSRISINNMNDDFIDETMANRQRVAIVFQNNEQTKVYINNKYQTLNYCHTFDLRTKPKLNLHLLPYANVGIQNIGIWKYALSEEHIRRLFTYALMHVGNDYEKLNDYRRQTNTLTFNADQKYFVNETLIPFNEPFDENLWETRKQHVDHDESFYFKTIPEKNRSVIQLLGNKTYLVLNTANQVWPEYTLILDIYLPSLLSMNSPSNNEARLTLLTLDTESEIYITHDGHICVSGGHQSSSTVKVEEYIRLFISVQQKSIQIYVDGSLEINASITDDQFSTKNKRMDLFRETDPIKNTTGDDQLRIQCQSITFWNKSADTLSSSVVQLIKSTEHSLDKLVTIPFSVLSTSLLGIGYKEESIKYVMEQFNTTNIHFIDTILREQHQQIENAFIQNEEKKKKNVITRLNSYDEHGTLTMLMKVNDEAKPTPSTDILSEIANVDDGASVEKEWFRKAACHIGIHATFLDWAQDRSKNNGSRTEDSRYKLVNLTKVDSGETTIDDESRKKLNKSLHYVHRQIPRKTYLQSRKSCEYGLITINARYTILNMLKVWSQEEHSSLFPLHKFGGAKFIVTLLRLMDYHYTCRRTHVGETTNWMTLLTMSILKVEFKALLKSTTQDPITEEILNTKAPLFYQLQKHVVEESIRFLAEPNLIDANNYDDETVNERMLVKQSNSDFLLKIINLFLELFTDSEMKKYNVDQMIRLLFPTVSIKILFDLFMLLPSHRSKIFILKIFTTLIQASENFKLHADILHFILQLFIELITNKACSSTLAFRNFRNATMGLAFAVFERQKELILGLDECPSEARNMWLLIDVMNIITSKEKQSEWPEQFLAQSGSLLGEKFLLTKDMVAMTQTFFDMNANGQLMKFLNSNINLDWNPLPHESLNQFIEALPAESTPDSTKYNSYTCLCDIPSVHIQTRAKLLYLFNTFLGTVLPMIDLGLPSDNNNIAGRIRAARNYILFTTKYQLFNDSLSKTVDGSGSSQEVRFDTVTSTIGEHPHDTMFYQAYSQAYANACQTFRKSNNDRVWSATFVGMHSTDAGGPYRDSLTRICADICSTRLPLFIICPNGRTNSGSNRDRWIPNVFPPNRPIPDEFKNQYRFVGQLMGMAIRTTNLLDIRFPTLLWKQLLYQTVTIEDIEAIDMQSFTIINQMEENIKQVQCLNDSEDGDYLFSSIMSELTFDVVSSAGQTYELIPGGFHTPITATNFEDYCMRYRQYRVNEFHRQINFIREGLYSIVPSCYLTLFTTTELEEAVCGKGYIDIDMLKRHTSYNNDSETTPHIGRFWTVLRDMFSEEQKKLFLIFVWGRNTLPNRDDDFPTSFSITRLDAAGNVDETLPKSHTCYFTLDLPPYSTKEIMYERLNYAITYCSSIDTDGTLN